MKYLFFFCFLVWVEAAASPSQKAHDLVAQLTLDEKITMVTGTQGAYVGNVPGIPRLSIPPLNMNDGPQGFRAPSASGGTSTQMPCGLAIGATWEPAHAYLWGQTMGSEFHAKGANVQLGPGMCIARVPRNGRNFEYISGEDPFLGATLVGPAIRGIQSQGVIANAKHYINNNQETNRTSVSANIDERTRMEIYQPPFAASVAAGVYSIMCSYNKINNVYACENNQTLNTELKTIYGFQGWVMSDWGATHSTVDAAMNGLDQEMPDGSHFGAPLKDAIANKTIPETVLDDKVYRILYSMIASGVFDLTPPKGATPDTNVTSIQHNDIARKLAIASTVLLKNQDRLLPLNASNIRSIAVFNPPAGSQPITGGGGSGSVVPYYQSTVLGALIERLMITHTHTHAYPTPNTTQPQPQTQTQTQTSPFAAGFTHANINTCIHMYKHRSPKEGKSKHMRRRSTMHTGTCSFESNGVVITYYEGADTGKAARIASSHDIAISVLATSSAEGTDRPHLELPSDEVTITRAVGAANQHTVAIIIAPGAVLTGFTDDVAAALVMFMPGQEEGHAAVDVLFGQEPGGRLPLSFPNIANEVNFTQSQWPGVQLQANYTERLQVGYRWYTSHNIAPLYAFGHGLSYTSFTYDNLKIDPITRRVSFDVINHFPSISGTAVPQVYVSYPAYLGEPPMQLKGFTRVNFASIASYRSVHEYASYDGGDDNDIDDAYDDNDDDTPRATMLRDQSSSSSSSPSPLCTSKRSLGKGRVHEHVFGKQQQPPPQQQVQKQQLQHQHKPIHQTSTPMHTHKHIHMYKRTVEIDLSPPHLLSTWDDVLHRWKEPKEGDEYIVLVGESSTDIRLKGKLIIASSQYEIQ